MEWFRRYRNLLIHKSEIRIMLKQERQNLLVSLQDYIHDLSTTDIHSGNASTTNIPENFDLPDSIVEIIRLRETCNRVNGPSITNS